MPRDIATPGDVSSHLYSLEDLRRFGPSTPDGLYTLDEIGNMLLCLTNGPGKSLCVECFRMGTGEKPCPHGTFTADTHPAPVLVRLDVLAWPEDQPQHQSQVGRPRAAPFRDSLQHWVTAQKAISLPPTATGVVTDGVIQTTSGDPALEPFSPAPYGAALCSPASLLEIERTAAYSSAAPAAAGTSSVGLPSFPSLPFMTTSPASSSPSSFGGARADTLLTTRTTVQRQLLMSHSAPPQQLAAHPATQHTPQHAYHHHCHAQQPAVPPPGLPEPRWVVPAAPSYYSSVDPNDSGLKHWCGVTVERTIGVFKDASAGFASTRGVAG
ncbi:hypothetical protein LXA43DRAFT_1102276 [Ganoderma leucocontextum]|nr:hypothetical protein LXA43DRAFT_1102276 [Ganoderma leucocontextum]